FMQGWHDEYGISLSERFFGEAVRFYPIASKFARITNWMVKQQPVKEITRQLLNISPERDLPVFAEETFSEWLGNNASSHFGRSTKQPLAEQPKIALFIDIFTNYHAPEIGKAAYKFLKRQGYQVIVPDFFELGRAQISKGMLKHAKRTLDKALPELSGLARQGIPVVGLEPSEVLTLRDEYTDLCDDNQMEEAKKVAENSYTFAEFAQKIL